MRGTWKRIRPFVLWAIGGLGTLLLLATQISPEQATSNLAAWAEWLGIDRIPDWLTATTVDNYAALAGALLALSSLVLGAWSYMHARRHQNAAMQDTKAARVGGDVERRTVPGCNCSVVIEDAIESIPRVLNPPRIPAKYVKVKVSATGQLIRNCRPSITGMRRITNGIEVTPPVLDPIFLRWSTHGEDIITVRSGVPRYFDILSCNERDNRLKFGNDVLVPLSLTGFLDSVGTYIFSIAIENDGPTKELTVEISWNGNCSEITAREIAVI